MKRILIILTLLSTSLISLSQSMEQMEDSLAFYLDRLRTAEEKVDLEVYNEDLKFYLEQVIERPEAFDYPFSKLETMSTLTSPDKAFRIFNWNIEMPDMTQKFECYVVEPSGRKPKNNVTELKDGSELMPPRPEDKAYDENRWFGCLYYKIIPVKKGIRTYYTMLGWDGNSKYSTKKLIETMYFAGRRIKFGYPLIKTEEGKQRRFFLEYSSDVVVLMNYRPTRKEELIVFDHVSPKSPQLEGMYDQYVPDGSYDAFRLENGYWVYIPDYNAKNEKIKDRPFHDPRKDKDPIHN